MNTSKSTWVCLAVAVTGLWLALISVMILFGVYRGHHPEALHGVYMAGLLAVFFGAPVAALFNTVTVSAAKSRGEVVPTIAKRSLIAAWSLTGLVVLYLVVVFTYAFLNS